MASAVSEEERRLFTAYVDFSAFPFVLSGAFKAQSKHKRLFQQPPRSFRAACRPGQTIKMYVRVAAV